MTEFGSPTEVQRFWHTANSKLFKQFQLFPNYMRNLLYLMVFWISIQVEDENHQKKTTKTELQRFYKKVQSTLSQICDDIGVIKTKISCRVNKNIGIYSYKIKVHQQLLDDNYYTVKMPEITWLILQNPFNWHLIFSDEATFYISDQGYKQDNLILYFEKPTKILEKSLHSEKIIFGVLCHSVV